MRNNMRNMTFFLLSGVTVFMVAILMVLSCGCQQAPAPVPTETASAPGATDTVTITPETPTPTPEVSSSPAKPTDLAPYSLSKGRRDPFVPFGVAADTGPAPVETKPTAPVTPGHGPSTPSIDMPASTGSQVTAVPVQVTGTFVSGGKNWAILSSTGSGGPSFMVSSGDRVGEYLVKSVDTNKVVLVWSGKEYVIKMQTFGPYSTPKGTGTVGETPKEKTLPAPEKPKGAPQPQMMPPPGAPPSEGSAPGGGTGEGAQTQPK